MPSFTLWNNSPKCWFFKALSIDCNKCWTYFILYFGFDRIMADNGAGVPTCIQGSATNEAARWAVTKVTPVLLTSWVMALRGCSKKSNTAAFIIFLTIKEMKILFYYCLHHLLFLSHQNSSASSSVFIMSSSTSPSAWALCWNLTKILILGTLRKRQC